MKKSNAFVCNAAQFGSNYPKLYFGPNFDPTLTSYPGLALYSATESSQAIITNSIRIQFMVSIDLPTPTTFYKLHIRIGGG